MNQDEYQTQIVDALEDYDLEEAYELLMSYYDHFGSDYFYSLSLSDVLLRLEEYYDVVVLLSQYADKNDLLINERLADALMGLDKYEEALSLLSNLPNDDDPELLHAFFLKGSCLYSLGQYKDALQSFEDILLESDDPQTLFLASLCYAHLNKDDRAYECCEKLSLNVSYLDDLMSEYLEMGKFDLFERSMPMIKDFPEIYYRLYASYYFMKEDLTASLDALNKSLEVERSISSLFFLQLLYERMELKSEADAARKELLELSVILPDMPDLGLVCGILDYEYQELTDEKEAYIRGWMDKIKTTDDYFDLGIYLADAFYPDLLSELLNDIPFPHSFYMRDTYRYQDLTTHWYFMECLFEEAYDYLVSIDFRRDTDYFRSLAFCCGNLGKWEQVLTYAKEAMPDGLAAVMGIQAARVLKDEKSEDFFKDSMEKARNSIFDSNIDRYDIYLETGEFLLPMPE